MKRKQILGIIAILLILLVLDFQWSDDLFAPDTKKSKSGSAKPASGSSADVPFTYEGDLWFLRSEDDTISHVQIEVADDDYQRARGLMDRRTMDANKGMLFIFEREKMQSFYMRNTIISLDIIYVKANGEIDSIRKYTKPYSEESIPSEGKAQYVVEVNAGYCDQWDIKPGNLIKFNVN